MNKEFVPYEQALTLKELGFDEPCFAIWSGIDEKNFSVADTIRLYSSGFRINDTQSSTYYINDFNSRRVAAPLYQQAFRWFREKYYLNANVYKWQPDFAKSMGHLEWEGSVTHFTEKKVGGNEYYNTYEEAELECLKKLIKLCQN